MIAQLRGTIAEKSTTEAIIDCGGVGYHVFISVATYEQLPADGTAATLLTLLIPRDDALTLYGFATAAERKAFVLLTSIPGIGPKTALGILSALSLAELRDYIIGGNLLALQKLPGIGKKTAERILVELRDQIGKLAIIGAASSSAPETGNTLVRQEALSALVALGYTRQVAEKAIKSAAAENPNATAEQLIRKGLKFAVQ
jgi:Holliday junction DNA helicase RuvA